LFVDADKFGGYERARGGAMATTSPVIDRVRRLIEPVVSDLGLDLYDLEQRGGTIRVTVDTPPGSESGVSLDTIAVATRLISRELDHDDPVPGKYTLEVTSPGVERALRTPEHFQREIGKRIALRLSDASLDERRFDGLLVAADDSTATIRIGIDADGSPDDRVFSLASIDRAKTIFEWGPQPKPGGPRRKAGASGTHPRKPEPSVADGADHDTEEAP
jgi:ribosome maturation factor RimP